jgi:hypothetical protein
LRIALWISEIEKFKIKTESSEVAYTCNLSSQEAETGLKV